MAKKKSGSKQGTEQALQEEAAVASEVKETVEDSESIDKPVAEDGGSEPAQTTGEVRLHESESRDPQMLSRLRAEILSPSDIYRDAQLFAAQNFDIVSLLTSGEPVLTHNVVEFLRTLERWYPAASIGLVSEEPRTREVTERYFLFSLKNGLVSCNEFVDVMVECVESAQTPRKRELFVTFVEKVRSSLVGMISQLMYEVPLLQNALTKLCSILEPKTVNRMLYDSNSEIRIAVIRSLMNRPKLEMNDLAVTLILLKDRDKKVNMALMKLYAKFPIFPELVIPQVLEIVVDADKELRPLIDDMFRSYGNDAVGPVINALNDAQNDFEEAVAEVISVSPVRYTSALLEKLSNLRTQDFVKQRVRNILQTHQDVPRRPEILRALHGSLVQPDTDYPQWEPKKNDAPLMVDPVTDYVDVYRKSLSDKEIAKFSSQCNDDILISLISDISQIPKRNAIRVVEYRKEASVPVLNVIKICMKSSVLETAHLAMQVVLKLEKSEDRLVSAIIEAMKACESDEVKHDHMKVIMSDQKLINIMIRGFYQSPRMCANFIIKFLHDSPSQETLDGIFKGLDRTQSVACISETEFALMQSTPSLGSPKLRAILMNLVKEPISFGHYGFLTRLYALKLIQKYLRFFNTERDPSLIQSLQAFYKEEKNVELRDFAKKILKNQGEEIYDFEDEDDNFEDLEEDHEKD